MATSHFPSEKPAVAVGAALSLVVWEGGRWLCVSHLKGNQHNRVIVSRGLGAEKTWV